MLRALLPRFCDGTGVGSLPLAEAVPAGRRWKPALPRAASADHLRAVLACCDRDSAGGRRDYAIVLAMTRLALRGGEVAGLQLADVGWRSGELTIRGKGGRTDVLPLPAVIFSFQDRHVVDLGGHVEDGVVDVTAVAA